MNITNTLTITSLDRAPDMFGLTDVVININYSIQAQVADSGESAWYYGQQLLAMPDVNNYTDYPSITQEQAMAWLTESVGAEQITALEGVLADELERRLAPAVVNDGTPW
jgi:hypothetical protein